MFDFRRKLFHREADRCLIYHSIRRKISRFTERRFTGKPWSLGRKEARALVEELGGPSDEDVTVRTTLWARC